MRLEGKVAIISGGARGLGAAEARLCSRARARRSESGISGRRKGAR